MSRTVSFAPVVIFQVGVVVSDGGPVLQDMPSITGNGPMAMLVGTPLYDQLVAKLAEIQANLDAEDAVEPVPAETD